jgi:HPt (histidine-containing phosphotransfer) domain-containing protein
MTSRQRDLAGSVDNQDEAELDLAHLERQTQGNQALEREVLGLFLEHSAAQLEKLKAAATVTAQREIAHSLAGSALAIGAFATAAQAREIEQLNQMDNAMVARLGEALATAHRHIAKRLAD